MKKLSASQSNISKHRSFLYDRANWQEFKNEINRKLIDLDQGEEIALNELNDVISRTINDAATNTIPKSQTNQKRQENYPPLIVDLIKHKRLCKFRFEKHRCKTNGDALKKSELEVCEAITVHTRKNGTTSWTNLDRILYRQYLSGEE